jgi:hypothetical protein
LTRVYNVISLPFSWQRYAMLFFHTIFLTKVYNAIFP